LAKLDFDHDMSTLTRVGYYDPWEIGWPKMRKHGGGWEWVGYLKHVANLLKGGYVCAKPIINHEVAHDYKSEHYNVRTYFFRLHSITKQLHDGLLSKIEVII
jgi:hypothetical protein